MKARSGRPENGHGGAATAPEAGKKVAAMRELHSDREDKRRRGWVENLWEHDMTQLARQNLGQRGRTMEVAVACLGGRKREGAVWAPGKEWG